MMGVSGARCLKVRGYNLLSDSHEIHLSELICSSRRESNPGIERPLSEVNQRPMS